MREAVEDMLSSKVQALKSMIESSNAPVTKLRQDIGHQDEVGKTLQTGCHGIHHDSSKHDVGSLQNDVLNLCQKFAEKEDRSRSGGSCWISSERKCHSLSARDFTSVEPLSCGWEDWNSKGPLHLYHPGQGQLSPDAHFPTTLMSRQRENSEFLNSQSEPSHQQLRTGQPTTVGP